MRGTLILAVAALLLLGGCARRTPARPALWRADRDGRTVWLLGSMHELPRGIAWETPPIRRAEADAEALVLEIGDTPAAAAHAYALAASMAPVPLLARVAPAERARLAEALLRTGLTARALAGLRSWAAAAAIENAAAARAGADPARGVEAVVTRRFADAGKPRLALESAGTQFAILNALPAAGQDALLDEAARDATDPAHGYRATLVAWAAGDTDALAATVGALAPALRQPLVTARNRRWAVAIARATARHRMLLVVVGAGHMLGADGLPALLAAQGYRVARVE